MKNEIGRKITSLTLMTIMLAGGMTIAFPGFTPDAYAVNANLLVSAENTGGYIDGAQVVEILVIDDDLASTSSPDVTVNGDAVAMTRTADGNWYAYIVDSEEALKVDRVTGAEINDLTPAQTSGIEFGDYVLVGTSETCGYTQAHTAATGQFCKTSETTPNVPGAVKDPVTTVTNLNTAWPVTQAYNFASTVEIQYNKAGGTQITTLQFTDSADGLSLDRSNYPSGADVHVTITDHRLNIDPTSDDVWTWNILSDDGDKYYGDAIAAPDRANPGKLPNDDAKTNQVCSGCSLQVNYNRLGSEDSDPVIAINAVTELDLPDATPFVAANATADPPTDDVAATAWFTVAEDGGPNTGIFTATNLSDESILKVVDDAQRNAAASITYDGTETSIDVKYSLATIEIQSPDDVWTSGLAIPIVVVDGDVNKNSLADDDLAVSDPNSIIPTLVTGDPFTLGEVSNNLVTWVGWSVTDDNTEFNRLLTTATTGGTSGATTLNYTVNGDNPFTLKGFTSTTNDDGTATHADEQDNTAPNAVVIQQAAEVELFSDRAMLAFGGDFSDAAMTSLNALAGTDQFNAQTNEFEMMDNSSFMNADFLVIDFDNNLGALQDSLIGDPAKTTVGHNFLNYNVESLGATPTSLEILLDGTPIGDITLGEQKGYINVNATSLLATDLDATKPLQFKLNFNDDLAVKSGEKYPIVIDFFSFGYENAGEASDERIANQIIRLELEESDSDTASLEGTLEYIMINQLNIDDEATYAGLTTVGLDVSFIVIEDLTVSSAPSVTYLDIDLNGDPVQVSAQEDAPSHSAVVSLDVDSFKAGDTVTVTLEDLDLNTDSDLTDIYSVVSDSTDDNYDTVGKAGSPIGRMLEITFDDQRWMTQTDEAGQICTPLLNDHSGLGATIFSLSETAASSGIFVGTFPLPAEFCRLGSEEPESVTGLDIEVNYVDFRDQSGETTEVGDSAGVKANTGSVSLDRTVYPVPFGVTDDFKKSTATTPAQSNTNTRSLFPIHQNGMDDTAGLQSGEFLPQGDLIVYVTVTDPDFDVSASGRDSIAMDTAPVTVSIIRGSVSEPVATIGDTSDPIDEIAPDAGIFESSVTIRYNDGPNSSLCPSADDGDTNETEDDKGCILLQGDILQGRIQ